MSNVAHTPIRSQAHPDLVQGIINSGSFNILAGASGVGKTCLLSWFLAQLQTGQPVFGRPVQPPTALGYIAADRGMDGGATYWLEKAGAAGLAFYSLADDLAFNLVRLHSKIQLIRVFGECLDKLELPRGSLVVFDPLGLFLGGKVNDYSSCAVACLQMRRECSSRGLTLIGTAHSAKQHADKKLRYLRLQDRILGSGALLGFSDTQLYLASPEETGERFYTLLCHPHKSPVETFPLGRDKEGLFVPWAESVQAEQEGVIFAAVPEDGSTIPLATILGLCSEISPATVHRRLQQLLDEGLIERPVKGLYRRTKTH